MEYPLANAEMKKLTEMCCYNHLADLHKEQKSVNVRWLLPDVNIKPIKSPVIYLADE